MKHKIRVMVRTKNGKEEILQVKHLRLRDRLLKLLFGDYSEVIVLNPTKKLDQIQIVRSRSSL